MRGDFLFNAAPKGYEEATTKQCTSRLTPTTMTTPSRSWRFDLNPGPGEARTSLARPLGFNPGALIEVNSSDYNPHIVVYLPLTYLVYYTAVVFDCSSSSTIHTRTRCSKSKLGKPRVQHSAAVSFCLCRAGCVVVLRAVQRKSPPLVN